jgi:glycosyltransferase involved in cell wall biosynthesis
VKILFYANTDWYLFTFVKSLAQALIERGNRVIFVSPQGEYSERLIALGFDWRPTPMVRANVNPFREIYAIFYLASLLNRERVDIVHSFSPQCSIHGSLAAKLIGLKTVVNSLSGLGYVFTSDQLKARLLRPLMHKMLSLSAKASEETRIILLNSDDVQLFEDRYQVKGRKIRLIPGAGVDCERFSPPVDKRRNDKVKILFVGRVVVDKGIREFVDAARILISKRRDVEFIIAGGLDKDHPDPVSEELLNKWVAEGLVEWMGYVEDMPSLLQNVDIIALPSYREGLPTCLTEGAASGLALVGSDVPGCRDVIDDGVNGLLCKVRDSVSLAEAISRLLDDEPMRSRLGVSAREKVVKEFSQEKINELHFELYEEILHEAN